MSIADFASEIGSLHDFSIYFPSFNHRELGQNLAQADIGISGKAWLSFCISFSICTAILSIPIVFALTAEISTSIVAPLLIIPLIAFSLLKYPAYMKKRRAEQIEWELSIALRAIALEISLKAPFEKVVGNVARMGLGPLSQEFSKIEREVEIGGSGMASALREFGERIDSLIAKRAVSHLIVIYESGVGTLALSKLTDELSTMQKAKTREYSGKMAILGLLFIAISCIIPALFSAYLIIGSSVLSIGFSQSDIFIAYGLAFPAVSALALLFIKEKSPSFLSL
ncbi:MAG: type II secretion system F family protein [Candidatus Micrarchaeota archaeon]